ncbi:MAG: DHH family phosphoesterase [Desulfatiglandaceae bacterium]|jgi:nanoRNase/pAp phosphatase (c-di-AMP/oligoRNAs hydrolase)
MSEIMDHPFAKSVSATDKCKKLSELVHPEDSLAILIEADPDAMSSAMALKRFFWRKVQRAEIFHINTIQRADNLAMINLLRIDQKPASRLRPKAFDRLAVIDSQPSHHEAFSGLSFDIIIDHHPIDPTSRAAFVDIKEEYGASATMMTEYLKAAGIKPSPKLATALFYGIKTDTANFARKSLANDIDAFRYLYRFTNLNIIKKIESSEITRQALEFFRSAIENVTFIGDKACIYVGEVGNPDILVLIADFFMKLAETSWSIVSGIYEGKLVVILRNAGFRGNAGKIAQRLFGVWGGSAGGHSGAARAEIPLDEIPGAENGTADMESRFLKQVRRWR